MTCFEGVQKPMIGYIPNQNWKVLQVCSSPFVSGVGITLEAVWGACEGWTHLRINLSSAKDYPIATVISEPYGWHFRRHCALGLCERFA